MSLNACNVKRTEPSLCQTKHHLLNKIANFFFFFGQNVSILLAVVLMQKKVHISFYKWPGLPKNSTAVQWTVFFLPPTVLSLSGKCLTLNRWACFPICWCCAGNCSSFSSCCLKGQRHTIESSQLYVCSKFYIAWLVKHDVRSTIQL